MNEALAEVLRGRIDGVVIGASAGGMEALSILLPALPEQFRAAVFVVLHLPRDRPSLLDDVFQRKCALRVVEAQDKQPVETGAVYFAPPDYHLLLDRDSDQRPQLALSTDALVHFSRPSIDVLFESAADVYRDRLLGIILSGANQDGAAGLAAVHRAGGIAAVQNPQTAQSSFMIESALALTPSARVLSVDELAALLRVLV